MATTPQYIEGIWQWTVAPGEVGDWVRLGKATQRSIQVTLLAGAGGSIDVEVTNKIGDANVPAQKLLETVSANGIWGNQESWEFIRPNATALTGANCIVIVIAR